MSTSLISHQPDLSIGSEATAEKAEASSSELQMTEFELELDLKGALGNHLILKEILKNFSVADLLKFSLVDHLWASCARTVLRTCKKCVAFVRRSNLCFDLKQLDTLIEKSSNVPFNGLSILPSASRSQLCLFKEHHTDTVRSNPGDFYPNLMEQLKWKHVELSLGNWGGKDDDFKDCPGPVILQEIIKRSTHRLQELIITHMDNYPFEEDEDDEILPASLGLNEAQFRFPQLKVLEIPSSTRRFTYNTCAQFVKKVLAQAPALEELNGAVSWMHVHNLIDTGKLGIVRELTFELDFEYGGVDDETEENIENRFEQILSVFLNCVRLQPKMTNLTKLSLSTSKYMDILGENPEKWFSKLCEVYSGLLSQNSETLQELTIDHYDLVILPRLRLAPLRRLESFKINTRNYFCHDLQSILCHFNYSRLFPNVDSVSITCTRYIGGRRTAQSQSENFYFHLEVQGDDEAEIDLWEEYTWPSVRKFCHQGYVFRFGRFAKVFPNVTSVTMSRVYIEHQFGEVCSSLWTAWPEVESISFLGIKDDLLAYQNMDPYFTGMSKRQVEAVREAMAEGKDALQYIRSHKFTLGPSIRNLKKLKTFRLEFSHDSCRHKRPNGKVFLTEITKKCALDRMPSLIFEVKGNSCKRSGKQCNFSLEHLQPNVKLFIT